MIAGHVFCSRGRRVDLLKVIWHDGRAASLYVRRLEKGRFLWPSPADSVVAITPAQMAAEHLHADDTTVPILAKGKTDTGPIWTYVRDDRPFAGTDPPAALDFASRDRRGHSPG